jgi:Holliday junction resolvasome RuvABC DNA-binding subunit
LGYEIFLPAPALQSLPPSGEEVRLFTHFHVREDAQILSSLRRTDRSSCCL